MIALTAVVTADGRTAQEISDAATIDAIVDGHLTSVSAQRFGAESIIEHACQRIETASGAVATVSNNALVWPEQAGYRNCQRIGIDRIRVLIDGDLRWEPAWATPAGVLRVAALVVPDGMIAVGQSSTQRILITGDTNAKPSTNR